MSDNSQSKAGWSARQGGFICVRVFLKVLFDVAVGHPLRDHDQFRTMHGCANQREDVGV